MDGDNNTRRLIADEMARKEEELRILEEMAAESGFAPRQSLQRTPPSGFTTPPPSGMAPSGSQVAKRPLTSPEDVAEEVGRRRAVDRRRPVPPVGGILTSQPARSSTAVSSTPRTTAVTAQPQPQPQPQAQPSSVVAEPMEGTDGPQGLASLSKLDLLDMVHKSVKGIHQVTTATNKLNLADKTTVASHSQDILAVVAALELRLSDLEHQLSATKLQAASAELEFSKRLMGASSGVAPVGPSPTVPSYANALKLPKGKAPIAVSNQGPAVIFYPADEAIKSSEETKKTLQEAVKPTSEGIKIRSVRMVGNSGIVVRTANAEAAQKLKAAAPPTLKVAEPKTKQPRVALRYLRADISETEILEQLHQANFSDDADWPVDKFRASCKLALKKQVGPKFLVLLECSMALRDKFVSLERVYIGWDELEVSDHIRACCCNKCHQYGHPEKYCRSKETVCGKCGETGHRYKECQSSTECCATCRRFKRKEAHTHTTASPSCPARQFAEQQAVNMLQYG
ncbi:uncharacterized protein LOC114355521 isoform X2 [Ostrinia furnacalis]|uniref:uncharacterized protein LOC114355521 isoform X1 n=1 Tax=Ostrinia furnacalis TaxID=93504 RepID=UPI001040C123|nr:uncharacterized protein LOC114355521 isoform X1 [Ostrinia furnacalis]XP_028164206.1 uncharacterized protein LOC114355521 isoform X2 [Ostrinia furnacalis]